MGIRQVDPFRSKRYKAGITPCSILLRWAMLGGWADLVLLDEPTNNLDPEGQRTLAEILRTEHGMRAVLLVSHEHGFLQQACDRVIDMAE